MFPRGGACGPVWLGAKGCRLQGGPLLFVAAMPIPVYWAYGDWAPWPCLLFGLQVSGLLALSLPTSPPCLGGTVLPCVVAKAWHACGFCVSVLPFVSTVPGVPTLRLSVGALGHSGSTGALVVVVCRWRGSSAAQGCPLPVVV